VLAFLYFRVSAGGLFGTTAMTDTDKSVNQDLADHVALQGTILELNRNFKKSHLFTWFEVFVLLVAIATPFTPIDRATTVLLMTCLAAAVTVSRVNVA
jgi:hypothetical protein